MNKQKKSRVEEAEKEAKYQIFRFELFSYITKYFGNNIEKKSYAKVFDIGKIMHEVQENSILDEKFQASSTYLHEWPFNIFDIFKNISEFLKKRFEMLNA